MWAGGRVPPFPTEDTSEPCGGRSLSLAAETRRVCGEGVGAGKQEARTQACVQGGRNAWGEGPQGCFTVPRGPEAALGPRGESCKSGQGAIPFSG